MQLRTQDSSVGTVTSYELDIQSLIADKSSHIYVSHHVQSGYDCGSLPCFNVMDGMRDISQAQNSYSLQLTTCLHQMLKTRTCGPFLCVHYWSWLIFIH